MWKLSILASLLAVASAHTAPGFCERNFHEGTCVGSPTVTKWYFNHFLHECDFFQYNGCGGNQNRFDTRELCLCACNPAHPAADCGPVVADCSFAPSGTGGGAHDKWRYNPTIFDCESFLWGGTPGSQPDNVYDDYATCAGSCRNFSSNAMRCLAPHQPSTNCPVNIWRWAWYFDLALKRCERFRYAGCGGTANNFVTLTQCEDACTQFVNTTVGVDASCNSGPRNVGTPCFPGQPPTFQTRYFFNPAAQACWPFYYLGCGGNANNYASMDVCERTCLPSVTCPFIPQSCKELVCRYGLKHDSNECPTCTCKTVNPCLGFTGCSAAEVCRVEVANQCRNPPCPWLAICEPAALACRNGPDYGVCSQSVTRYYWDTASRQCRTFTWSSCGGNSNNFVNLEDCNRVCRGDGSGCTGVCPTNCGALGTEAVIVNGCATCRCRGSGGTCPFVPCSFGLVCVNGQCVSPSTPSCFTPFPSNQNGPCQLTTQWYFTSTRCLSFSYTGCDKNAYFSSEPACVSACGGQVVTPSCSNQPKAGFGCQTAPAYFFHSSGQCLAFQYSGCDKDFFFSSLSACTSACGTVCPPNNCGLACPVGQVRVESTQGTCRFCSCQCRQCPQCPFGQRPRNTVIPGTNCPDCTCCQICQTCPGGQNIGGTDSRGCPNCGCCPQSTCLAGNQCPQGSVPQITQNGPCTVCQCVSCPVINCATFSCGQGQRPQTVPDSSRPGCNTCICVACPSAGCPASCVPGVTYSQQTSVAGCPSCQCVPCQTNPNCAAVQCPTGQVATPSTDANGCRTCTCTACPPSSCPQCNPGVTFQYQATVNGCPFCTCVPCPNTQCGAGPCPQGQGWQQFPSGFRGCNECRCAPCTCPSCPAGQRPVSGQQPAVGCPSCSCVPDCPVCDSCPPGQSPVGGTDQNGCPNCRCACPPFSCSCLTGQLASLYQDPQTGCQGCDCVDNPCEGPGSPTCPSTTRCIPVALDPRSCQRPCQYTAQCEGPGSRAVCQSPVDPGFQCQSNPSGTRYYYNPNSGSCVQFSYGGCGGNQNNFNSMLECMQFCGGTGTGIGPQDRCGPSRPCGFNPSTGRQQTCVPVIEICTVPPCPTLFLCVDS